ncbi:PH domain-containing protein [Nocardioides terrigena]|uniref:PH domain-containing protein n=1 Tax=Nocardioides terrigena TaxID=424797 RepID=UPI000D3104A4|nr:PH domain-containing protein [Nocardioides terrigena]
MIPEVGPAADPGQDPDPTEWQRLDPRNLLLDPVKAVGQFLVPAVIAFVGLSSRDGGMPWWSVPLVVLGAVVFGVLPWLTTSWRVTATQFQKRTGLLNKTTSTAPLDRVRSVDLEASLLHRVLGLSKVQIGTGVDDDRITLDAVSRERAADLRALLLARRAAQTGQELPAAVDGEPAAPTPPPAPDTQLAAIDWSWLRFAPFSLTRLVLLAGLVGLLAQFGEDLPFLDPEHLSDGWQWVRSVALWLLVPFVLIGGLLTWVLIAVTGYVVQWWDMRLTRGQGSLHLTAGLFTTRSISVEETRVRGVEMREPLLLRAVGGGELSTLATGVGSEGVTRILPPCPRQVCVDVGHDVLAAPGRLTAPLTAHGPSARRREHVGQALGVVDLAVLSVLPVLLTDISWLGWWLPAAVLVVGLPWGAAVAEASYRHLGHALAPDPAAPTHLVVGHAQAARVRTVLETDGIIGWVVTESWFQRRLGLVDLVATTAAGAEKVVVHDVPRERAVRLADSATPGVLTAWTA